MSQKLRKLCIEKLSKYATVFDYIDKVLIVFKATSGGVYTIHYVSVVVAQVGMPATGFTFLRFTGFSLITGIIKKLPNITRNKKNLQESKFTNIKLQKEKFKKSLVI